MCVWLNAHAVKLHRNSYTMVCLPICGDNPRALAGVQSPKPCLGYDNHDLSISYTTFISVDFVHYEIYPAEAGRD